MSTTSSTRRCIQFSLKEIKEATNQFSNKILGHGGEAVVYYAEIYIDLNKTPVAVKRFQNKGDNSEEIKSEINTLSKIQHHPNIVSLIGYCDESGQKFLVYEYMEKGSLSGLLKKKNPYALTWLQRLNICLGVARGLQHLHSQTDDFPKGIIHRDMKPANILVGKNWIAKVSDFGTFKLSTAGQEISIMPTGLKGTRGFFAPEYSSLGLVTRKIDVYSFGVVLLYVLCEKTPWSSEDESYYFDEKNDLGKWALENIVAQIRREISRDSATLFTDLIGRSLQQEPGKRPTMDDVVLELQKVLECSGGLSEDFQRCRQFSLEEIIAATELFDESHIITGREGSGNVYFAELYIGSNKTPVAVERLRGSLEKEFEKVVHTMSKIQHPNIVSMLGYCYESGQKILVYEDMRKGYLSDYLKKGSRISLSWLERLNVCLGAARGLLHLHTPTDEYPNGIIHRDVKAENILVGENWVKLSVFGIFKVSKAGQETSMMTTNKGASGYFAPEHVMLGRMTRKTDVFAFGVVLFQVLCRESPWDRDENEDVESWAVQNVDAQIRGEMSEKSLTLFTDIIGRSLREDPGERPTMNDVVLDLQKAIECQEYENLEKQLKDKDAEK